MTKFKRQLLPLLIAMICALGIALFAACGGKVEAESVTLNETELTLEVDGVETLTATVAPENAEDKTVTWTSSDPAIASVDENGNVTAVSAGTATVTATTANGKTATCEVTVEPKTYQRMTKAEWEAAFDATLAARNFTVSWNNYSIPNNATSANDCKESIDQIKLDDVNGRIYHGGDNDYYVVKDGIVYRVNGSNGTKEDLSEEFEDKEALFDYFAVGLYQEEMFCDVYRELYDAIISFDESANAYVVSIAESGIDTFNQEVTLIFADGKFSRIEITQTVNNFELVSWMAYSDYGTTVVESPAFDDGESVTPAASNEVTAEQWAQILGDVTNYTINISAHDLLLETNKLDDWTLVLLADRVNTDDTYDMYFAKEGEKYYIYENKNGIWVKEESEECAEVITFYRKYISTFKDAFNSFTYSETEKQYSCDSLNTDFLSLCENIKAKFENNALVYFVLENDGTKFEFSSFGTTVVELPTDYEESVNPNDTPNDTAQVTEEQWEQILGGAANYTISVSYEDTLMEEDQVVSDTTNSWKIALRDISGNGEYDIYLTCEDGKYFEYHKESGEWVKEVYDPDEAERVYHYYAGFVSYFSNAFDSFTYSETDQMYACDSLDFMGTEVTEIAVRFDDNALVYFAFVDREGFLYEVDQFGTTVIELPL